MKRPLFAPPISHASLFVLGVGVAAGHAVIGCSSSHHSSTTLPDGGDIIVPGGGGTGGGSPSKTMLSPGHEIASACRWLGPGSAKDIAFSPDGMLLGTASGGFVKLYDAATGKERGATPWEREPIGTFSLSPSQIAVGVPGQQGGGGLVVYDRADLHVVQRLLDERPVSSVAFSPDGKRLAAATVTSGSPGTGAVEIWTTADYSMEKELTVTEGLLDAIAFSADGSTLIAYGSSQHVWSTANWQSANATGLGFGWSAIHAPRLVLSNEGKPATILGYTSVTATPPGGGMALSFDSPEDADLKIAAPSHDGTLVAAGDAKGRVFLWEVSAARPLLFRFAAQSGSITGLAFAPDDSALAATSEDGSVYTWRVRDGRESWHSGAGVYAKEVVGASRDGSKVVVHSSSSYAALSAMDGTLLGKFPITQSSCTIDKDAQRLACSGTDGPNYSTLNGVPITVGIDPKAPELVGRGATVLVPGAPLFAQTLTLRRDNETRSSTGVRLWNIDDSTFADLLLPTDGPALLQSQPSALAASDDGSILAASLRGNLIGCAWDVKKKTVLSTFDATALAYRGAESVAIAPDGTWIAFAVDFLEGLVIADPSGRSVRAYAMSGVSRFKHLVASPTSKLLAVEIATRADAGNLLTDTIVLDVAKEAVVATIPGGAQGTTAFLSDSALVRDEYDGATSVWCLD